MLSIVSDLLINLHDFEAQAKAKLPQMIFDYYASGAADETTLAANLSVFDHFYLKPRVLVANHKRDLSTELLGQKISMPLIIAPTAMHGMACEQAEVATATAANNMQTIMTLSTMANSSLTDVIEQNPEKTWLQLYILNDTDATLRLVKRAEELRYNALVLTVDSQTLGLRERDLRNQFKPPDHLQLKILDDLMSDADLEIHAGKEHLFDKNISWKDIERLRQHTKLPILLKGILNPLDAQLALDHGVNGIIISNHGGRQLDCAIPSLLALTDIAAAVGDKTTLLIDGGIRRGTDIFKALALGADVVLIGRPIIWGLSVNGSQGAQQVLTILKNELDNTMALCGFSSIREIKQHGRNCIGRS